MIIQKIKIDGYKNVLNTTINFEDITALIGLNNYGKSNILEAIRFANDFIKESKEEKSKRMRYSNAIPMNIKNYGKDFDFEIEFITKLNSKEVVVSYEYSFQWPQTHRKGSRIIKEFLKIKENEKGKQFSTFIERSIDEAKYRSSESGRCDKLIKIDEDDLVLNKLKILDNLFYQQIITELNNLKFDFNYFMDAKDAFDIFPFDLKDDIVYELNKDSGANIAKIVYALKQKYNDKYELLMDSFLTLFSNIEKIEPVSIKVGFSRKQTFNVSENFPLSIPESIYKIVVKEKYNNTVTEFKNLSNGTKRIFLLLTSAILADIQNISLIAFEELENCIHPYLFQQLLLILSGIIENSRIIITSHSPYLIQYLDINKIYIGIPSKDGAAHFKKVRKSKQKSLINDAEDYKMTTGDYIFNLMAESFDDNSELCSYLECE